MDDGGHGHLTARLEVGEAERPMAAPERDRHASRQRALDCRAATDNCNGCGNQTTLIPDPASFEERRGAFLSDADSEQSLDWHLAMLDGG